MVRPCHPAGRPGWRRIRWQCRPQRRLL